MPDEDLLQEILDELMDDPVTRAELLRRAGVGAAALATAGSLTGAARAEPQATPRPGGQLVVGAGEDSYRRTGARANIAQYPVNANVYETLVRMTPDYALVPMLATAWQFRPPNTWRITLRRGVRFHDGRPFTAEAVKWTFDRIASYGGGTAGFGADSTKIVNDYTVEITPKFENRRLIEQLVHPQQAILAPGTSPENERIGTGPFRFVSYREQEQLTVARFDRYWGRRANLAGITFRFLPDPNARRLALEAGNVDLIVDVPREAVRDLRAKGFAIRRSQVGAYSALYCKIGSKGGRSLLSREPNVRKALAHAIDRRALINGVYEGLAKDEQTMVPGRLLGPRNVRQVKGYGFDRARARRLLDTAGWRVGPDGIRQKGDQRLSLRLVAGFPNALVHGSVPEFLQDQFRRIGVELNIVKTPDGPAYEARLSSGEGELWLEQGSQNDANPVFLPALLFWSVGLFGDVGYQPLFSPAGRFDTLIVSALKNPDSKKVRSITADALKHLIDQNAVVLPLAGIFRINAMRTRVRGFIPHPSGLQVSYRDVWLG